ncbi:hypothetical protein AB0L04_04255, partial [Streptomyces glaucescens]|uniref:hypothetical protein n=1 Tax=Streptomyces glaucescens TaxID=1907 RepID=UPI00344BB8AD
AKVPEELGELAAILYEKAPAARHLPRPDRSSRIPRPDRLPRAVREGVHRRRSLPRSVRACARVRGSDAARRADAMARRP